MEKKYGRRVILTAVSNHESEAYMKKNSKVRAAHAPWRTGLFHGPVACCNVPGLHIPLHQSVPGVPACHAEPYSRPSVLLSVLTASCRSAAVPHLRGLH